MKNKKIITNITFILMVILMLLGVTGCAFDDDADVASYNVSKEADNFKVKRRIVFINLRSDTYLYEIIGNCSIKTDSSDNQLEVIC